MRRVIACRFTYCLPVAALLCSCAAGRGSLDGRVVNEDRGGAGVPGAFVVITRQHDILFSPNSDCEDQELAITDAAGRFHFGRWSAPIHSIRDVLLPRDYWIQVTVYQRGFVVLGPVRIDDTYEGVITGKAQAAPPKALLANIRAVGMAIECHGVGDWGFSPALRPLTDALKADAAELATTPEELDVAVGFLSRPTYPGPGHSGNAAPITPVAGPSPNPVPRTASPTRDASRVQPL